MPEIATVSSILARHAAVPVCGTLRGCMEHVRFMSLKQRWADSYKLSLGDPNDLPKVIWEYVKRRRQFN